MEVSELVESVDILEYISQFCDFEEKNGEYWALSPLKDENTPSFSVNTDEQVFYDFSSGAGGDVLTFIQKYYKCGYTKALKILREYAGVSDESVDDKNVLRRLPCTKVMKLYKPSDKRRKESKYTVLDANYMDRYQNDPCKRKLWEDEGISQEVMDRFQVRYDPFSERIVFPIRAMDGSIINVCGRTVDPLYKEKKLRKYTYFHPLGILDTLYGFSDNADSILEKNEIILFEGAKSVMLMASWGIYNTAAVCTSHLNPEQFRLLLQLGVRVVFALDKGVEITEDDQIARLKRYVNVEAVVDKWGLLEDKMAPVDAGKEVWDTLYGRRITIR